MARHIPGDRWVNLLRYANPSRGRRGAECLRDENKENDITTRLVEIPEPIHQHLILAIYFARSSRIIRDIRMETNGIQYNQRGNAWLLAQKGYAGSKIVLLGYREMHVRISFNISLLITSQTLPGGKESWHMSEKQHSTSVCVALIGYFSILGKYWDRLITEPGKSKAVHSVVAVLGSRPITVTYTISISSSDWVLLVPKLNRWIFFMLLRLSRMSLVPAANMTLLRCMRSGCVSIYVHQLTNHSLSNGANADQNNRVSLQTVLDTPGDSTPLTAFDLLVLASVGQKWVER